VDNGDGTVTDYGTGLMWEQQIASTNAACTNAAQASRDERCEQNTYTWSASSADAPDGPLYWDFLQKLNGLLTPNLPPNLTATPCFAGHCDWRIPTIGELRSIISAPYPTCTSSPCVDPIFGPTQQSFYWSSTSPIGMGNYAWTVGFGDGHVFPSNNKGLSEYARAVRYAR
jgi:hypothetical protein